MNNKIIFPLLFVFLISVSCSDDDAAEPQLTPAKRIYYGKSNWAPGRGDILQYHISYTDLDALGTRKAIVEGETDLNEEEAKIDFIAAVATTPNQSYVYFTDGADRVQRIKKDGTGEPEVLFDAADGVEYPKAGLVIDEKNGVLYWVQRGYSIMKGNLDGSGKPTLVIDLDFYSDGMQRPLVMDIGNQRFYVVDRDKGIFRFNADGTGGTYVYSNADHAGYFSGLAFDELNDRLYTIRKNGNIDYIPADGASELTPVYSDLGVVYSLSVDPVGNRVFWQEDLEPGTMLVANLDGSGGKAVVINGSRGHNTCLE